MVVEVQLQTEPAKSQRSCFIWRIGPTGWAALSVMRPSENLT